MFYIASADLLIPRAKRLAALLTVPLLRISKGKAILGMLVAARARSNSEMGCSLNSDFNRLFSECKSSSHLHFTIKGKDESN